MSTLIPNHPKASVADRNAYLTVHGCTLLVERVINGRLPVAHVSAELGSRATGYKWIARYRAEGAPGLLARTKP